LKPNFNNQNVIHIAHKFSNTELIEMLYYMFDPNQLLVVDNKGNTPFHIMCREYLITDGYCLAEPYEDEDEGWRRIETEKREIIDKLHFVATLTPKSVFVQKNIEGKTPRDILSTIHFFEDTDIAYILHTNPKGAMY